MLKFVSWNINGLRACLEKRGLQNLIQSHQPDVLCLQEIKATPNQVATDIFSDYQAIWNPAQRKGYSGTLILSKLKILSQSLNFSSTLSSKYKLADQYGDTNDEGRVTTVEFENFYIITVYTPNSKGDLSRLLLRQQAWDPAFREHCQILSQSKPVLVCGDLNVAHQEIDLARPKENIGCHGFTDEERLGFDKLLESGFLDSYRQLYPQQKESYSWWTYWHNARAKNIGWRIDYWLISQKLKSNLQQATIHADIFGSDHCPVSIEMTI
ncbi:MAG: exodeoxyribonuclease III [Candidatus Saccharibacteria bacterium]|nr:exodeoxyribonuclease III [Candidatus Saccharibacteria bacterium]